MIRKKRTQMRLALVVSMLALALLTFGLAGTAMAAGADMPAKAFQLYPLEGKGELVPPIRCPDRMCFLSGSGCGCDGSFENPPFVPLPLSLSATGGASSGVLLMPSANSVLALTE